MAEPPATTINDLPYEMLEKVIPDLKPKTISSLKLVNRRFYSLLSNDKYFKPYVNFPEKHYLCEIKNEKNSGKEVVEQIKNGNIGKWKGYLTLDNLHLGNLKCGNITGCEFVLLAPPLLHEIQHDMTRRRCWKHQIDGDGEYWLVSQNLDGHIELVNITNVPKTYVDKEISPPCEMYLIPGQVICMSWQYLYRHIMVLNIVDTGDEISLQRHLDFVVQSICWGWGFATVKCKSTGKRRNFFAYYSDGFTIDGTVHFRDLETGNILPDVCLWDYPCLKKFGSAPFFMRYQELHFRNHEYEENPYIALQMRFVNYVSPSESAEVIVVINVDSMKATSFAHIPTHVARADEDFTRSTSFAHIVRVVGVHLTRNGVYTVSLKHTALHVSGCDYSVEVQVMPLEGHGDVNELKIPKLSYNIGDFRTSDEFRWICACSQISLHGKLLLHIDGDNTTEERVIRLDKSEVYDVVPVTLDDRALLLCNVIGHDVLVAQLPEEPFSVKMFKMKQDGAIAEELVTWNKMLSDYNITFKQPELVLSQDISKLVIYDARFGGNDQLAIFHF